MPDARRRRRGPEAKRGLKFLSPCAQLTLDAGHSHFRILEKGEEAPRANEYGSYRTATIEMLDSAGQGEVYDAAATEKSTVDYLIGPSRYR